MSLDLCELVLEIEETFGVTITGRDAERIHTVGDLYEYLLDQRTRSMAGVCPSGAAFYRARRAVCDLFGARRCDVSPRSAIEELLPARGRRGHWRRFCKALRPFSLPDLRRPVGLGVALGCGCAALVLLGAGAGLAAHHRGQPPVLVASWFIVGALLAVVLYAATLPLAVSVPAECSTMRELVDTALGGERDRALAALGHRSERQVWERMCEIISRNLGVDRDLLKPGTDFVNDLGI
jgi:acyl carrier protein